MNKSRAFTFTEVVISVVIAGILAAGTSYFYRKHVDQGKYAEGMTVLNEIKDQQDLCLSFMTDSSTVSPFEYIGDGVLVSSWVFSRKAQGMGTFTIDVTNNKYFNKFEIRNVSSKETNNAKLEVTGDGYVAIAYCDVGGKRPLKITLVGSVEGPYTVIKG